MNQDWLAKCEETTAQCLKNLQENLSKLEVTDTFVAEADAIIKNNLNTLYQIAYNKGFDDCEQGNF